MSSKFFHPHIPYAALLQLHLERLAIEVRHAPRHGERTNVHQRRNAMRLQRGNQFVERPRGVADGVEGRQVIRLSLLALSSWLLALGASRQNAARNQSCNLSKNYHHEEVFRPARDLLYRLRQYSPAPPRSPHPAPAQLSANPAARDHFPHAPQSAYAIAASPPERYPGTQPQPSPPPLATATSHRAPIHHPAPTATQSLQLQSAVN